jgi:hypothetical protein
MPSSLGVARPLEMNAPVGAPRGPMTAIEACRPALSISKTHNAFEGIADTESYSIQRSS